VNKGILSTTQNVKYNAVTCLEGFPIGFLLTVAMPKSPNQNSAQLNNTADTANGIDLLNNENTLSIRLIKVASPVNPIHASRTMNAIDLRIFPILPSSSQTRMHELVLYTRQDDRNKYSHGNL
jgi:hypothetical protein